MRELATLHLLGVQGGEVHSARERARHGAQRRMAGATLPWSRWSRRSRRKRGCPRREHPHSQKRFAQSSALDRLLVI